MNKTGLWETIYFLRQGDHVKIGHTKTNLTRRIKSYRTHSLEETVLLGFTHGDKSVEREFHAEFSASREKGEWFRHEGALAVFLTHSLPLRQQMTERLRMDEMRRYMSGEMKKVPREFPRPTEKPTERAGRKLISRGGKIFNMQGKRVLTPRAGDRFVDG